MERSRVGASAACLLLVLGFACSFPARAGAPNEAEPQPPRIERVRTVGEEVLVVVGNPGAVVSLPVDLVVTTRAAGRMIGSARHDLGSLAPGEVREERLPLSLWGSDRPALRAAIERQGCCTTRVWLEPGGAPVEIEHPFPVRR